MAARAGKHGGKSLCARALGLTTLERWAGTGKLQAEVKTAVQACEGQGKPDTVCGGGSACHHEA